MKKRIILLSFVFFLIIWKGHSQGTNDSDFTLYVNGFSHEAYELLILEPPNSLSYDESCFMYYHIKRKLKQPLKALSYKHQAKRLYRRKHGIQI